MQEFLTSGHIGGIGVGSTVEDLHHIWGQPDDVSVPHKYPRIEVYGDFEFHLREGNIINLIYSDNFTVLSLGESRSFDPWFFTSGCTIEEASSILGKIDIPFTQTHCTVNQNVDRLDLESGVSLMFCRQVAEFEHPGHTGLYGFSLGS